MPSEFPCPSVTAQSKAEGLKKVMKQEFLARLNSMKHTISSNPSGGPASSRVAKSLVGCPGVQLPPPSLQRKSNEELNKQKR